MVTEIIYVAIPVMFTIYTINIISFNTRKHFEELFKIINKHEMEIEKLRDDINTIENILSNV
jgi:hypothetical protein